ncbi:hypothetical protein DKM44_07175 [Deinococcus irradiatisoli]|uniref:SHOCT domain-containing protein n=1 Tax=Deinococcus irradiatisoli TaxID=2202254 RepID=A0A2Z3JMZ4_9DEIO|nr:hypothetical protein [Deinococcus irradiatisoli]AWN23038.1 hypothetical protein DKM44_07175 [Deinococcus irradiatisoli]
MDVIINNPASPTQAQYAPMSQLPYGPGPGYGYGPYHHHHGGPGFLLPLLLIGGVLLWRRARRRRMRGWQWAGQSPAAARGGPDFVEEIRENFKRGRERFMSDSALNIVRERFARGELSEQEYHAAVKALMGDSPSAQPGRVRMDKDEPDTRPGGPSDQII